MQQSGRSLVSAALVVFFAAAVLAAGPPVPVSPGAANHFAGVGSPCPTFSWSAVDKATGYEVVVYQTPDAQPVPPGGGEPVLRAHIPAGAVAWTPPAELCLELEGTYAWLVRAIGRVNSDWSETRLFRVDVDAVLGELAPVLRRAIAAEFERAAAASDAEDSAAAIVGSNEATAAASTRAAKRGVFTDEVELWLQESGSSSTDKVQLVFATPEFDGDPSDAWAIVVDAEDSADPDDGRMFFSSPSFFDPLQLFTDGTAIIGDLRQFRILPSSGPPVACTSALLQGGTIYYDSDINALCVCDGSSWAPVDSDNMGNCS